MNLGCGQGGFGGLGALAVNPLALRHRWDNVAMSRLRWWKISYFHVRGYYLSAGFRGSAGPRVYASK